VYSLACLFYECLTGAKPFATGDLAALIGAHLSAPPPRPTERRPDLPPGFDTVVLTGMAKEPGDRYGGAGELATAAYRALAGQPLPPPPIAAPPLPIPPGPAPTGVWRNPAPPRRRSSAPLVLATVVALLAGITITSIVLLSNRSAANANSGTSVTSTTTTTTPTSITTTTTPTTTTTTPTTTTTTTTPPRQSGPSAIGTVQFGRCNDPGVRSHVSNRGNFLNVVNNSSQPVYFNWLDLNGVWQRHSYVAPNMPGQVQTDQGTWWVATDAAATCIALFQGGGQLVIQ
jgi:serine/threonine-protein kinase